MRNAPVALLLITLLLGCPPPTQEPIAKPPGETPVPAPVPIEGPGQLTLATYNVWFGKPHREKRVAGILSLLGESEPNMIALQEVEPWFVDALLREGWTKGYHWPEKAGRPHVFGGLFLLSKIPFDSFEAKHLRSNLGRGVMLLRFSLRGERWAVATCHLESYPEDGPLRAAQLDAIFALLKDADHAILMGDFNLAPGDDPESGHLDPTYQDVWPALHPKDPGFTWDMLRNPLAKDGAFPGEASSRLDRILVRSSAWRPRRASLLGDAALPSDPQVFPSDHFGVLATLEHPLNGGD